ncbi:hypothetical protein [uncultured Photobacterium sp.]|uniref:hypothetical protein n=1 Tax=uncultured Photobacterium sp. TaxID=173973 RepID=UPI0026018563|nr:hypothetical protein [uncultured Photobacterium sp.]
MYKFIKPQHNALEELKNINSKKHIGSIVISDSVILTIPFGESDGENIYNLKELCIAIKKIQSTLIKKNIWLRGAVSCGDTYFNKFRNQIVGSAYIDAYLLEENVAKYPRVILDNRLIKELKCRNANEVIQIVNGQDKVLYIWDNAFNGDVIFEKDLPLFIDYLTVEQNSFEEIIELIEDNARQNISLYSKFKWISKYLITKTTDRNIINRLHEI